MLLKIIALLKTDLANTVGICKSDHPTVSVTIKGAHLGMAKCRSKALRPQSYHLFPSLMSHSTMKHSGNMSREWEI